MYLLYCYIDFSLFLILIIILLLIGGYSENYGDKISYINISSYKELRKK